MISLGHPMLFDNESPTDAFAVTDDFVSAGRISGAESIPITKLRRGSSPHGRRQAASGKTHPSPAIRTSWPTSRASSRSAHPSVLLRRAEQPQSAARPSSWPLSPFHALLPTLTTESHSGGVFALVRIGASPRQLPRLPGQRPAGSSPRASWSASPLPQERSGVSGRPRALGQLRWAPRQPLQEGAWFEVQRADQLYVGVQLRNALAPLKLADCRAMQPRPQAEVFLRQLRPFAGRSEIAAEPLREGHQASSR